MSQADHAADIAFSTAFTTDKICGIYTDTVAGSAMTLKSGGGIGTDLYQKIIPHPFTRPVECDTIVSTDGGATFNPTEALTYSDSSNIYFSVIDNTKTYLYKIVCTWIDDYDTSNPLVAPVLQTTDSIYFDSRKNYRKVLKTGVATLNNPGAGISQIFPVAYSNNGLFSSFKVYFESKPNEVWPLINGGAQDVWLNDVAHQYEMNAGASNSQLLLEYIGASASAATFRAWYKIYYEQ